LREETRENGRVNPTKTLRAVKVLAEDDETYDEGHLQESSCQHENEGLRPTNEAWLRRSGLELRAPVKLQTNQLPVRHHANRNRPSQALRKECSHAQRATHRFFAAWFSVELL